jgi:hypothetical protein
MEVCKTAFGKFLRHSFIICGTRAAVWSNLKLGLPTTLTLEVVPFRVYAPFSALPTFFKRILELAFCEGAQHHLRFCLNRISGVKMAFLPSGKRKVAGSESESRLGG